MFNKVLEKKFNRLEKKFDEFLEKHKYCKTCGTFCDKKRMKEVIYYMGCNNYNEYYCNKCKPNYNEVYIFNKSIEYYDKKSVEVDCNGKLIKKNLTNK